MAQPTTTEELAECVARREACIVVGNVDGALAYSERIDRLLEKYRRELDERG